jgi:ribosomal-protein-alanine N-acetyltransferase
VIRAATEADHAWIRRLSAEVYAALGDYDLIIGSWLDHPGVLAQVDEHDGARRGFILLGFHPASGGATVADLLAIAVDAAHRRRGLGARLLEHAIHLGELARRDRALDELRLTVAEDNPVARRLFEAFGFRAVDEDHGRYDGGQRAIRMARRFEPRGT